MPYIGRGPVKNGAFRILDDISGSFNGSTTSFALTTGSAALSAGSPETLTIAIDGVMQEPGTAYTISGSNIVFGSPPPAEASFWGVELGDVGGLVTTAATQSAGDNTTNVATTAFVTSAVATENEISEMNDVTLSGIASGEVLKWNGSAWVNNTLAELGVLPVANPTFTGTLTVGSAAMTEADLEMLDGITAGTAAASKAVVLDSSTNITGIGTIGSGAITSSGVVTATGFTIGSAAITEAELEILDGATVTTTELNLLDALDRGSILYGNSSGVTTVLGQGGADTVLTSDGTDISWQAAGGGVVSGSTDNAVLRADGTGGSTSQGSAVTIADTTGDITLPATGQVFAGNGAACNPGLSFQGDTNTGLSGPGGDILAFISAGTEIMRMEEPGRFFVLDWGNSTMSYGITINQVAADNEIFALKSSDVAHGATSVTETDTFGVFSKVAATPGGLRICGLVDTANNIAVEIRGLSTGGVDTTKDCGSAAYISIKAGLKCGTGFGALGANQNIFAVRNNTTTRFIIDEDGDLFADGGTTTDAVTVFDEYCDAQLARTFTQVIDSSGGSGLIDNRWDDFIKYNECTLIDLDLLGGPRIGVGPGGKKGLINYTGMVRLHSGAIWQLHSKLADQQEEITALKGQLQALTGGK